MKLVIVESPYAARGRYGEHPDSLAFELRENLRYAREALRDCLLRDEAPFASHLLYPQEGVLDDAYPGDRQLGMSAGWGWMVKADLVAVYRDLGMSRGMEEGIAASQRIGREMRVEHRWMLQWDGWKEKNNAKETIK